MFVVKALCCLMSIAVVVAFIGGRIVGRNKR
jgi:hypothetical protein